MVQLVPRAVGLGQPFPDHALAVYEVVKPLRVRPDPDGEKLMLVVGAALCGPTSAAERHQLTVDSSDRVTATVELFGHDYPIVAVAGLDGRNGGLSIGYTMIAGAHARPDHVADGSVGFDTKRLSGKRHSPVLLKYRP